MLLWKLSVKEYPQLPHRLTIFSANLVKNIFKPLSSLASPLTTGTTSSQAQENDWVSPAVPMTSSLPPLHAPTQRANVRKKQYQTVIHWASRQDFAEYMLDCNGGVLDFDVLPIVPRDKVKHPCN